MAEAQLRDFRFHDLRHSAASYLAMNGATPSEIAEVLGHKTLAMVKRYAHLSQAHTAAAHDGEMAEDISAAGAGLGTAARRRTIGLADYQGMLHRVGLSASRQRSEGWNHPMLQLAGTFALLEYCVGDLQPSLRQVIDQIAEYKFVGEGCAPATRELSDLTAAVDRSRLRLACARAVLRAFSLQTHWPVIRSSLAFAHLTLFHACFAAADDRSSAWKQATGTVAGVDDWFTTPDTSLRHAVVGSTPAGLINKIQMTVHGAQARQELSVKGVRSSAIKRAHEASKRTAMVSGEARIADGSCHGVSAELRKLIGKAIGAHIRAALKVVMLEMKRQGMLLGLPAVIDVLCHAEWPRVPLGSSSVSVNTITSFRAADGGLGVPKSYRIGIFGATETRSRKNLNEAAGAARSCLHGAGRCPRRKFAPGSATTDSMELPAYDQNGSYTGHFKLEVLSRQDRDQLSNRQVAAIYDIRNPNLVVAWRRALDNGGVAVLESRRQARQIEAEKPNPELTDTDSPSSHRALREEVERLRAEVAYLKKLQALVRERQAAQKERKPSSN